MHRSVLLLTILALSSFTWATNFGLLTPLLRSIGADVGMSDAAVGQLGTLHAIATGLTALLVTPWMDRVGRGRLLRVGAALLFAGTICSALAPGFGWLFPARLLAGIGAAFIMPVCLAAAADLFPEARKRNQAVGLVIAATALGGVIGMPLLIQIDAAAGWRWTIAALLIPIAIMFAGSFGLPSRATNDEPFHLGDYARHYRRVLGSRETNWLLTGHLLRGITWYASLFYLGAFALTTYGLDADRLSLLFIGLGSVFFVATNLMPVVARAVGHHRLYTVAIIVLSANYLVAGQTTEPWGLYVFVAILCLAGAGVAVAESVLLLDSHPSARGGVMSLRSASVEIGMATGAALAAILLVLTDDYASVYRSFGLLLPPVLLPLMMSRRRRVVVAQPEQLAVQPSTGHD
jgi:predicted MFS family arabinose efflux permease